MTLESFAMRENSGIPVEERGHRFDPEKRDLEPCWCCGSQPKLRSVVACCGADHGTDRANVKRRRRSGKSLVGPELLRTQRGGENEIASGETGQPSQAFQEFPVLLELGGVLFVELVTLILIVAVITARVGRVLIQNVEELARRALSCWENEEACFPGPARERKEHQRPDIRFSTHYMDDNTDSFISFGSPSKHKTPLGSSRNPTLS